MTYTLHVAGLTRELPLCPVNDSLDIAAFVIFSDVELTVACAAELLKKVGEFDVIVTAESKGIPLAYECARQSGKQYIVGRKSTKLYMTDPISVNVKSITTAKMQTLYLSQEDAAQLRGRRVLIIDDVISTGESLIALEKLVEAAEGNIVCKAAVLAEGKAADRDDIVFLEKLPVFPK
ncbi:adenine phosphoribosyltransferase [Ruminococcus sp. YE71]|uniref:phosphoribosyltransferase family protein n=1 Tax=unclassified Ruminococcus TaxID=2608920 RepID=UPI00088E114A|nr:MULTISPECIES: phosphoribosyltransferase family protein [unclassified Ruminococcus]SDA12382.1 adenine phosphoribosyltransferase [Ruminococcus sp. YE78]SFW16834.1 adenine phosphoribosyltransferase [Ruminococcus sp. YE71]